jgi:hypothetical protein
MRIAAAALALTAGVALAGMGLAGMALNLRNGAVDAAVRDVQSGKPISPNALETARLALRQSRNGREVAVAGVVAADQAMKVGAASPNGRVWLERAAADLRRGLSLAPADGYAWLRLAGVEMLLRRTPRAMAALRMGSYAARNEVRAAPLFLATAAALWPDLDADIRGSALSEIRELWPSALNRSALKTLTFTPTGREMIREAAGLNPEVQTWIATTVAQELERRRAAAVPIPGL